MAVIVCNILPYQSYCISQIKLYWLSSSLCDILLNQTPKIYLEFDVFFPSGKYLGYTSLLGFCTLNDSQQQRKPFGLKRALLRSTCSLNKRVPKCKYLRTSSVHEVCQEVWLQQIKHIFGPVVSVCMRYYKNVCSQAKCRVSWCV